MNSPCLTVPLPRSIRKIPFFSLAGIKGRARGLDRSLLRNILLECFDVGVGLGD